MSLRSDVKKEVFSLYKDASLWVKFHNFVRWKSYPFKRIAEYVPEKGRILELGCGYGLMSNLLAIESPHRNVLGIDISLKKIDIAEKTMDARKNIQFKVSDVFNPAIFEVARYNCIVILDVLYLVPLEKWEFIFENCYNALEKGGVLLVKEQDTKPKWKYYWNLLQEFFAVKVLRITAGKAFTFPGDKIIKELLVNAGFFVESFKMGKGYLHPHILFVCRKA